MSDIFDGAAAFCALQRKDYSSARAFYEKAFAIDPSNLQDVYQLSVADLEMNPLDLNGLWYCSKAIQLAKAANNNEAVSGMVYYCKAKYKRYHGGEDGWDQLVAQASSESVLPADFAKRIKPATTPCDLAVEAVQQNDPATLSFSDKEFILTKANCSQANKAAADTIWRSIQDLQKGGQVRLKLPELKVIGSASDYLDLAISDENKEANKADVHVVMEKPMLHPPAIGSTIDIIGELIGYVPEPFMFTMEQGELPQAKTRAIPRPSARKDQ